MSVFKFGWLSKRMLLTQNRFGHRNAAGQRVQPQVEQLEERLTPTGPVHDINSGLSYGTIQAAVNAANPNDVIQVDPGTYAEQVTINISLTLRARRPATTPIPVSPPSRRVPTGPRRTPPMSPLSPRQPFRPLAAHPLTTCSSFSPTM